MDNITIRKKIETEHKFCYNIFHISGKTKEGGCERWRKKSIFTLQLI